LENIENDGDFSSYSSEEDDIISYRAKTSVISSNLATVEEPSRRKKNRDDKDKGKQK